MAFQWEWEQRIETLERANLALGGKVLDLKQEIEVLTTERDNALLEIDRLGALLEPTSHQLALAIQEIDRLTTELDEQREAFGTWTHGGVNPNA